MHSEYSKLDFNKILNKKLDLVLRGNAYEIIRNNKLNISRLGILSFHHGDNSWNRGGPPGFWETYLNKPQTGFVIQKLDNVKILFKGEFATKRSYILNKYNLLKESNPFLIKIMQKVLSDQKIPNIKNNTDPLEIFKIPSIKITIKYILIKISLLSKLIFKRFILQKKQRWNVAYSRQNFQDLNFNNSINISNLKNRYFADPFVVYRKNKHFIFVEDYRLMRMIIKNYMRILLMRNFICHFHIFLNIKIIITWYQKHQKIIVSNYTNVQIFQMSGNFLII